MVTSMMVEDQMRGLAGRPLEEFLHNLKTPSDSFVTFIKDQPIASLVAIYYTLQVFILSLRRKSKDLMARNQNNGSEWGHISIHRLLFQ
jgi:hypothetical protein